MSWQSSEEYFQWLRCIRNPDGIYILTSLPDGTREFVPQPFVEGSSNALTSLVGKLSKTFSNSMPHVKREWEAWLEFFAPKSDYADEYCKENPLVVLFWNELFCGGRVNTEIPIKPYVPRQKATQPAEYETTNSVVWSNRGQPCAYLY